MAIRFMQNRPSSKPASPRHGLFYSSRGRGLRVSNVVALAWCLGVLFLIAPAARAAESETAESSFEGGRVPLRTVGGRLLVRCDISTPKSRIAAHLLVALEDPSGLQLHNTVPQDNALDIDKQGYPVTLHFPGFRIVHRDGYSLGTSLYDTLTRDYAVELGETPVVGTLGAAFLRKYHVVLDVGNGYMELSAPKKAEAAPDEDGRARPSLRDGDVLLSEQGGSVWLPLMLGDRSLGAALIATGHADSRLASWAYRARRNANAAPLLVGSVELNKLGGFLRAPIPDAHPDGAAALLGLNILRHLRIELDRANLRARVTVSKPPADLAMEMAYFNALRADDAEVWLAFLGKYPSSARRARAAELMVDALMASADVDEKTVVAAVKHYADSRVEKRRTSRMYDLMRQFREFGWTDAAIASGKAGLKKGVKDLDPNAVHRIHAVLGEMYLSKDDTTHAWKHLLSAAFGLPEDGLINLLLGRFYEKQKRYRRAFSRYIQATTDAASGPQALEALQRLQTVAGEGGRLSADTIERATAGKVKGFGAPDEFEADDKTKNTRCALVEYFTCAHGRPTGDWVIDGILTHFPRKRVAVVCYHVPEPVMEPLITNLGAQRAARYRAPGGTMIVGGTKPGRINGKPRDVAKIYSTVKPWVYERLAKAPNYEIRVDAKIEADDKEGGEVVGSVTVKGDVAPNLRLHILLVEKGVVFPGRSKVIVHRMVVRGRLTKESYGDPYKPKGDASHQTYSIRARLADIAKQCSEYVESQKQKGAVVAWNHQLDPDQLQIVAFLQSAESSEVLQAVHFEMNRASQDDLDNTSPKETK